MNISKSFARYVSQNIFGMLGISCYIIADTFFISKAGGADGITVLNLALPVYNLIFGLGAMIGVGSATRFSILRAGKSKEADRLFTNAILWCLIIGALFISVGIFSPQSVIRLMGGDDHIVAMGIGYHRTYLLFTPFFMLNHVVNTFVRNDGSPGRSMVATVVGSLSNIVLDYVFMFPLGMGMTGAALATAVSPIISIAICSTHFLGRNSTLILLPVRPSFRMLLQSIQLGVSAFVGEMSSGVTTAVFNFVILGLVGNIGVAAYGIIANVALVATAIFNGISLGMQPLVSRCFGEKNNKAVRQLLVMGIATSTVFALAIYGILYAATDRVVGFFNSEGSAVMACYAHTGMRLYFLGYLFAGYNIIVAGFMSATEQALGAFITSLSRGFVTIIGFALLLSALLGFEGVWLSFVAAEGVTALIATTCIIKGVRSR